MVRLLDLFCGAGGAAMGYHQAGFDEIVGVDLNPQPRYPFEFVQGDALEYVAEHGGEFDAIHASPPCQAYSIGTRDYLRHPDLYALVRSMLLELAQPWVIENVIGAPYESGILLCGSMFDLPVRRHRNFETSFLALRPGCDHAKQGKAITVAGHASRKDGGVNPSGHSWKGFHHLWPQYMEMPWATPQECGQAIPPAYTEYIGRTLMKQIGGNI
jgi:DNA (cytosine-5)-methyltransferase 1